MTGLYLLLIVIALLALRQNLLVVLGVATGYAYLVWGDGALSNVVIDAWDALNKDVLLSIPLFILAGNIMSSGQMADRLIRIVRAITAPIPGGMAVATILSCAIFAAISGSSTVTLLAVGSVMYPALIAAGYSKRFALGALCAAGTLGIIVPPSIPLILYGVMTQTSIADLFIAGIGPALLLTALLTAYSLFVNRHMRDGRWDNKEVWAAVKAGGWALLMPVIILGGIYSGIFTATESAAVAVFYAMFVELVIYRQLSWSKLNGVINRTTGMLGSLFPVLMIALSFNVFLAYQQVPDLLVERLTATISNPTAFTLSSNVFLLLIGCLMDIGSAILILAPLLQPVAEAQGIDPVHFGIMMIVNLEIGYLTPPLGLNIIVAMTAFRESFWDICKATLPFMLLLLVGLLIVAFVPALSLFLI